jgi:O-antigen/teichoic acid export membrane protein
MSETSDSKEAWQFDRRLAVILDQALLSGGNLAAFLLFARHVSAEAWGQFAFAYAAALFAQGFQRATVTVPLVAYSGAPGVWIANAAGWRELNSLCSLTAVVLLGVAALGAFLWFDGWLWRSLAISAVIVAPMFVQEFCRRWAIQEGRFKLLVGMSAIYFVISLTGGLIVSLFYSGSWMPVTTVALSAVAASAVFAACARVSPVARCAVWQPQRDYFKYAGWASLGHFGYSGYNFGIQAMLGAMSGPAALGVFHACRILVQPISAVVSAMDGVDKPRAAAALEKTGIPGMAKVLRRSMQILLMFGIPYIVILSVFSSNALEIAFGDRYQYQETVVWLWCLVGISLLIAQPVESGLYVVRRTRDIFVGRLIASVLSLVIAFGLIPRWGPTGALVAMVAGYMVTAVYGYRSLQLIYGKAVDAVVKM